MTPETEFLAHIFVEGMVLMSYNCDKVLRPNLNVMKSNLIYKEVR